jgi:anti-sigma B factor antagonist
MSGSEHLAIERTPDGFRLTGELDAHAAPDLAASLSGVGAPNVVLDVAGIDFVDSSGLRVLIDAHQVLTTRGGALTLRAPSTAVRRLLEVSGVGDYLTVEEM